MKITTGYVSNGGAVYGTLEEAAASDFGEAVLDVTHAAHGEYHHLRGHDFLIGKLIVEALPALRPMIAEYDRLIALDAAVNIAQPPPTMAVGTTKEETIDDTPSF